MKNNFDICLTGPPKCGNHWLLYIINNIYDGETHFDHTVQSDINFKKLIMIVRNHKEAFISNFFTNKPTENVNDEEFIRVFNIFIRNVEWYDDLCWPVYFFDNCQKPKIWLMYEELIAQPEQTLLKLANFLEIKNSRVDQFMLDFEKNKLESLSHYPSITKGNTILLHSFQMKRIVRKRIDKLLVEKHPKLEKYFKQYFE